MSANWTGPVYHFVGGTLWVFDNDGKGQWRIATQSEFERWNIGR